MSFLIRQTLIYAIPLMIVALAGIFAERSGIINLALEGIMIFGAFIGVLFVRILQATGSFDAAKAAGDWMALQGYMLLSMLAAAALGAVFSLLLAFAAINLKADQTIGGTALNMLAPALVLFLISAAVVFTLNFRPLYYFDVDHLNITAMSGLPREEILQNYNVLIDYNSIFGTKVLNFPTLAMSESGRIHFEEVKNVFGVFEITLIISGILSLAGIIYRHFKKNPGYLLLSGILTVAIPAALGVLIALNWETVFVLFHKIVFHNNYWIFDAATDPVITILPDTFFMHCALMILALVVLGSIICLLAYRHAKHKKTHTA